jgi:hypothetical protein
MGCQTIGAARNTDRIYVHLELGGEPKVEAMGNEDVFVAPVKLIGETPETAHLSPLFVGKETVILPPLDPASGVQNVLVDALNAVAVQVEHLYLVPRIFKKVFPKELSTER